ncbi:nuclear transport factor 2 family protein [Sphingobium tyrosinilyticum]|uniref:Nuclear transport factor 2 family protein n=1 Tax=Sphingobium tyrosinilyticum TaxID=2715436 RepID=A0ABV9F3W7_9SPHN
MDIEAIKQLKARYFRLLDRKDWAGWTEVWEQEIEHEMPADGTSFRGAREDFVAFVARALTGIVTVHHGQTPEIKLTSPTSATGIWAFVDRLKAGPDAQPGISEFTGFGHYHESYVKSDAGWRIKTQRVTRLRMDIGPAESS